MPFRVGTHRAKTHLSEYINRVAYGGERVIVERHGKPVAALVSLDDLRRLETLDTSSPKKEYEAERERNFQRRVMEAGLIVRWTEGPGVPSNQRKVVSIEGQPLSEQIVVERR